MKPWRRSSSSSARADGIPVDHPKLEKMAGDALKTATVKRALSEVGVVIQSLGVSAGPEVQTPIARWSIHSTGLAGSSHAPTSRISLSSRLMTIPFCIRRRCSRAPFLLRGVRPRGRRAAEQRDELAAVHSITSSARASTVGGSSKPIAFAVLRLMTSSYLFGACTGSSAGFSPLRMRSTYPAARRY